MEYGGPGIFINVDGVPSFQADYQQAWPFSSELALVRTREGKYGYIDVNEQQVIAAIYDFARSFLDDLAAVRKDNEWQYIDKAGEVVLKSERYASMHSFSCGLAAVDLDEEPGGSQCGFINKKGEEVIPTIYNTQYGDIIGLPFAFSQDLAWVGVGFLDTNGTEYLEN